MHARARSREFAKSPRGQSGPRGCAIQRAADTSETVQGLESMQSLANQSSRVQELASYGLGGSGGSLPHGSAIQSAFGRHSIAGVRSHMDAPARDSARDLGARAYASEGNVAFAEPSPSLFVAAHEATHALQQRAGVAPSGLSSKGDPWERHADSVAEAVSSGQSAEGLLDQMPSGGAPSSASATSGSAVQCLGESDAVRGTRAMNYRRGNRRGSITGTGGQSRVAMDFARKLTSDKETGWRRGEFRDYVKEQATALVASVTDDNTFDAWFAANEMHVSRIVYDVLLGANCGDFAFATGSRLLAATTGQWVHYGAMKDGYDHAFAITYHERIPNGDLPRRVDKKRAIVADTWADNLVTTLEEFMAGDNPYGDAIDNSHLGIKRGLQARGATTYAQEFPISLRQRLAAQTQTMWQNDSTYHSEWRGAALRERTGEDVFDFATDGRMKVHFKNGTQLFPQLDGLTGHDLADAVTHWSNHTGATFSWASTGPTVAAIEGLAALGGAAQTKTYALMNALSNNGQRRSMINALTPAALWTWVDTQAIKTNSSWSNAARSGGKPTMRHIVRNLNTARLRLLETSLSTVNWRLYFQPSLSSAQARALR